MTAVTLRERKKLDTRSWFASMGLAPEPAPFRSHRFGELAQHVRAADVARTVMAVRYQALRADQDEVALRRERAARARGSRRLAASPSAARSISSGTCGMISDLPVRSTRYCPASSVGSGG